MTEKNIDVFKLKIVGIITMIMLNISLSGIIRSLYITIPLGIIGAMSLTIFTFIITESVKKTSSLYKYMLRILLIAVISAYPYLWVFGEPKFSPENFFNSALTAFICVGAISMYDKMHNTSQRVVCVLFITALSVVFKFDWAPYAILLTFVFHIYRNKLKLASFYIITGCVVLFLVSLFVLLTDPDYPKEELYINIRLIGCILPLPLIKKYNGNLGIKLKWPLYFLYPIMLLSLFFIKRLLA